MPDVHLPQYYRETFFSGDSLLQADASGGNYGIEGNAILQNLHGDDVITTLLLCSFILAVIAFSKTTGFMLWQLRNFFYLPHEGRSEVKETTSEVRSLCYLILLSSTVISLLYYFHTMQIEGESFLLDSPYQLLAVFLVCVLVFFCLKYVLYLWVNSVFFGGKRNVHWKTRHCSKRYRWCKNRLSREVGTPAQIKHRTNNPRLFRSSHNGSCRQDWQRNHGHCLLYAVSI